MTSPSPTSFRMLRALRRQCVREVSTLLLFTSLLLQSATAVAPGWWDTQQVLTSGAVADDYTVANIGQLKNVAKKAAAEMNNSLPGGAGTGINSLIAAWNAAPDANVTRDDYAALTIGQLKSVVRLYYDRLAEAGVTPAGIYPWSGKNADDYALANLGQLKSVFRFETSTGDANLNGIPDVWELKMFGNLSQSAGGDFDQDGLSNLIEYQTGTDPAKIDTDGDGVSDGDEVAQGTDPANPPPSWKWTQAQLAEAEAAYEIGLQQRRREVNTVVQPSGGGPNPEDAVSYAYQTYLDDNQEIWTGSCTTNELGTATELAEGANAAHPKVDLATLKEWGPISPSGGTGVAELTSSGGVEAYATIERGVGTAKSEFRLVRRLKAGATAPEDSEGNLIKPEMKRTYLKVTTILPTTGTTPPAPEVVTFTIPEGADISDTTSGVLFPDLTTEGTYSIALLPIEVSVPSSILPNWGVESTAPKPTVSYKQATEVKIATWENSFEHTNLERIVRWWVANDMDHVRVRMTRPDKIGQGPIKVKIKTKNPTALSAFDDPANEVELTESTTEPGIFESVFLLVSDDVDDIFDGRDETLKDYTHMIAVGGELIIEYEGSEISRLKVKEKGRMKLRPLVLWYHGWPKGYPAVQTSTVENDVKDIRKRYAQAGIAVEWDGGAWGIDVNNVTGASASFRDDGMQTLKGAGLTTDEVSLSSYITSTYPSIGSKDIVMIYSNLLHAPGAWGTGLVPYNNTAYTLIPSFAATKGIRPMIVTTAKRDLHTMAHETLHIVLDDVHPTAKGRHDTEFLFMRRLWSPGGIPGLGGGDANVYTDRKRMSKTEQDYVVPDVQNSPFTQP